MNSTSRFKQTEIGKIPKDWEIQEIEKCLEKIIDYRGKTPKKAKSGIETLSAKSIKKGRIDYDQVYFISEKTFGEWEKRGKPQIGDVLLTTEGPLGEVAQLDKQRIALAQRLIALRGKENILDNTYLKYFLMSPLGQHELFSRATGTTVQGIKQSEFRKIRIIKPPFQEQQLIAKIPSDLDVKIEFNRRMNRTLKAVGKAVFRHWFVDFEFPDEKGEPYKSSGGKMVYNDELEKEIPKGWNVADLRTFGKIVTGKTPPKSNKKFFNGVVPFIKIPDMHNQVFIIDTEDTLTEDGKNYQSNKIIPPNSICVSCIATVGLVSITTEESQTNQQINSIIPHEEFYFPYLFYTVNSLKRELEDLGSGGSATLNVNKTIFSKIKIINSSVDLMKNFYIKIMPLLTRIRANLIQNRTLSQIRDSLLPQLIFGKIRVPITEDNVGVS